MQPDNATAMPSAMSGAISVRKNTGFISDISNSDHGMGYRVQMPLNNGGNLIILRQGIGDFKLKLIGV
jgi:hypothetical protein